LPYITSTDSFKSETVIAYELGWRVQAMKKLSGSLSGFYNVYDDIRSVEPGPPPYGIPVTLGNGVKGETYGVELAINSQPLSWLNIRGGYTFLKKDLRVKPGSKDLNKASAESNDPENQFLLQAAADLPLHFQFGAVVRYVDKLQKPLVPEYTALDLRLSWKFKKFLELSVVGQNLLNEQHLEFKASTPPREIQRSVYGKIICRF
jgi:iron complex outermembrane receptor protein